ncbi:hypothetical protein [Dehalogenimonas alkenigignens]|jgi:hypothetical protein|uniref:Uncharacterized protein n=1 Tax=Dehalogenimonas alkenigignens TaxID=1217799 RepID=A0A0W0GH75_9CHLR|nr:hypothetical protein [Dehalogenimonas alkenigignens]KTB47912.1 hypothetical protein DEALK_07570 [Dehalogenimonas alkenigignens]PVV82506.1 hypothetical protein DD509_08690 [Dehalogenimonas alkenigignens]
MKASVIYTSLSLIASALFLLATLGGEYTTVERIGGAVWVFMLSMIILMPLVTSSVKKRSGG